MMASPLLFLRPKKSYDRSLLLALGNFPSLELRQRSTLFDPDKVTDRKLVLFVVGVILLRTTHSLLHDRMGEAAFDAHHDGLVLFVAHDDALQHALRHLYPLKTSRPAHVPTCRNASAPQWF